MRITKAQKQIFDAHLEAFKMGFDKVESEKIVPLHDGLIGDLKKGAICPDLWAWYWERYVSMTSQLMASPTFNYISKTAIAEMRKRFRVFLTRNGVV